VARLFPLITIPQLGFPGYRSIDADTPDNNDQFYGNIKALPCRLLE